MRLTEKDFKEYFPKDNRFLHYCAKHYGLSFHNDEVVEEASYRALENVMRMYNRNQEFENEAEKTGLVMSSFRYGILSAYDTIKRRRRLDCRTESEVTYGDSDDEYNKYQESAVSNDKEYDNLNNLLLEFIDSKLTPAERIIIKENIIGNNTYSMISSNHGITVNALRAAKERAIRKLRNYAKTITSTDHTKSKEGDNKRYVSEARSRLRIQTLIESAQEEQDKRNRYSEALAFVYLDE